MKIRFGELLYLLLVLTLNVQAENKLEYKFHHNGSFYGVQRFEQAGLGKYLLAHLLGTSDSLLVVDVNSGKPINLQGLYGAFQRFDLVPEQNLVLIHTGESRHQSTSFQCFIYDDRDFTLKKIITVGKAIKDTSKSSWSQPQDVGYQHLLAVTNSDLVVLDFHNTVMKYSIETGKADSLFALQLPQGYYINFHTSSFHKGMFTAQIYNSDKQSKILWYNSQLKDQKLIDISAGYQLKDFQIYNDAVKWYLFKNNEEKRSKLLALDLETGSLLQEILTKDDPSKLVIDPKTGRFITANCCGASLWESGNDGTTYKQVEFDLEIGENIFSFGKSKNTLITADFGRLWIYDLAMRNELFSVSIDMDSKEEATFKAVTEWPGKDAVFYLLEMKNAFKFESVAVKYSSSLSIFGGKAIDSPLAINSVKAKNIVPHLVIQDGHHTNPTSIAFAKNRGWMITGDDSGEIICWDLKSKLQVKKIRIVQDNITGSEGIMHLAVHPQKEVIAVSWNYNAILLIDFEGNELNRLKTDGASKLIHFSEDGKYFFFNKIEGKLSVMDLEQESILATYDFPVHHRIYNYAFSGNSRKLALPSGNGTVKILDALTGVVLEEITIASQNKVVQVAYHPEMDVIATLGSPLEICLTNISTNKTDVVMTESKSNTLLRIDHLILNRSSELVLLGLLGSSVENKSLYNLLSGKYNASTNSINDWELYYNTKNIDYISGAVADSDGNTIWSFSTNNTIDVWDVRTKSHVKAIVGNTQIISSVLETTDTHGLIIGTHGDASDHYLRKMDFSTASFNAFDGVKYGIENLYANNDGTYMTSIYSSIQHIDLKVDSVLAIKGEDTSALIIGNIAIGTLYFKDGALSLLKRGATASKIIYHFNKEEKYHNRYYWESYRKGGSYYRFDEDGERLFLYDLQNFWSLNLKTGEKQYYSLDKQHEEVIAFEVVGDNLLIASKNSLHLYGLLDGTFIPITNILKQVPVFSNAIYPTVIGRSQSGRIALSYVLDETKVNEKSSQQLEVFLPKESKGAVVLPVKNEPIFRLLFSADDKHLFIVYERQIEIIDLEDNKLTATLAFISGGKFIMFTPDNYYFASSKFSDIGFNINDQVYDITQFDLKFNRPDIVIERLGYANKNLIESYKKAYQKRLGRLNIKEETLALSDEIPHVSILNHDRLELITSKSVAELVLRVVQGSERLNNLSITINDVPVFGKQGIPLDLVQDSIQVIQKVILTAGVNLIRIIVRDVAGSESLTETVEISYKPIQQVKSKIWFVGVGVSEYKDSTRNLTYADKDIKDLQQIFKEKHDATTTVLLNSDVTLDSFQGLKEQLMQTHEEDVVVLSLSGHGLVNNKGDFFFAGHETDFKNPENSGVPFSMLEWMLDGIPARKKLLMIDACHSGELENGYKVKILNETPLNNEAKMLSKGVVLSTDSVELQNSFELMKQLFTDLSKSNGAEVISAAGGLESAFENDKFSNGVFTYCLKKALVENAADKNNDKEITVGELKTYMVREVSKLTGGIQKPTIRQELVNFDWVIW